MIVLEFLGFWALGYLGVVIAHWIDMKGRK